MYAIIRTGGKQYRVAPGDVLRVEKLPQAEGNIEFTEVLAASTGAQDAGLAKPGSAKVLASLSTEAVRRRFWSSTSSAKSNTRRCRGTASPTLKSRLTKFRSTGTALPPPAKRIGRSFLGSKHSKIEFQEQYSRIESWHIKKD